MYEVRSNRKRKVQLSWLRGEEGFGDIKYKIFKKPFKITFVFITPLSWHKQNRQKRLQVTLYARPTTSVKKTLLQHFFVHIAKAGKNFVEIKKLVETVYGDKGLTMRAIYTILKKVKAEKIADDQRWQKTKKTWGLAF